MRVRLLALLLPALTLVAAKPCGFIPGGELGGQPTMAPATWTGNGEGFRCQIEMRPADPYSINANCYAVDGALYVYSYQGARKRWTRLVEADPEVRVAVDERIYDLRATRVTDATERGRVLAPDGGEPSASTWLYRLEER